jgi:hypothetical protein
MKKHLILALFFSGCIKPGYICLYEVETTNVYPPAKSFKSYKIDSQFRYCAQHDNYSSNTNGNSHSNSNRLRKEMENTSENVDKMQDIFANLVKEEINRNCTVDKK